MNIFPEPGHRYQLKTLGIDIEEPLTVTVKFVDLFGVVNYQYKEPKIIDGTVIDNHVDCHLSDFVLMIDKEVDAPEGGE